MDTKSESAKDHRWLEFLPLMAGTVLFILFLLQVRTIVSPLIALGGVIFALYPIRRNRWARSLILLAGGIFFLWLLAELRSLLFPFVCSFVLAYLLDPLIDRLQRWKIPRTVAILAVVGVTLLALIGLGIIFVPKILGEIQSLIDQAPGYAQRAQGWLRRVWGTIRQLNLPMDEEAMEKRLLEEISRRWQIVVEQGLRGILNITLGVTTFLVQLFNLIIIPFVTFYLLRDFDVIRQRVRDLMPREWSQRLAGRGRQLEAIIGSYLRGQLLVCCIVGFLTGLGLFFMGIDYALLLGTVAGILNIIPYVGLLISLVIAGLVALFGPSPLLSLVKVIVVFAAVQGLEGTVISPRIIGQKVGLHPVVVMLSLLIFAHFFGFVGLILAIPATAILTVLFQEWVATSREAPDEN